MIKVYEAPISDVSVLLDSVQASNQLDRWETPIDPD